MEEQKEKEEKRGPRRGSLQGLQERRKSWKRRLRGQEGPGQCREGMALPREDLASPFGPHQHEFRACVQHHQMRVRMQEQMIELEQGVEHE